MRTNSLDFISPVVVRDKDELIGIINDNPFTKRKKIDVTKLHVTLLADEPKQTNIDKLKTVHYKPMNLFYQERKSCVLSQWLWNNKNQQ